MTTGGRYLTLSVLALGLLAPAGVAQAAAPAPAPTSLVLRSGAVAGFTAAKPDVSHGPQYDDGCKATGGKVLTLERGGVEVDQELDRMTQSGSRFDDAVIDEDLEQHTSAAAAQRDVTAGLAEARRCGFDLDDSGTSSGTVRFSRPPAERGLTSVTRIDATGAKVLGHTFSITADVYRRGRYLVSVTTFEASGTASDVTFHRPTALQATADRLAAAKLVGATPGA